MLSFSPESISFKLLNQKCKCPKEPTLSGLCDDKWGWDLLEDKILHCDQKCCLYTHPIYTHLNCSGQSILFGPQHKNILFHTDHANHTKAFRGNKILNEGKYYWEIIIPNDFNGTSLMFGICTQEAPLYHPQYKKIIGSDKNGWGLDYYSGCLYHNGVEVEKQYLQHLNTECQNSTRCNVCKGFRILGLYFDGIEGTLTYYINGVSLGIAFSGFEKVSNKLFPVVSATAIRTMILIHTQKRDFCSLEERCRAVISSNLTYKSQIDQLELPQRVKHSIEVENKVGNIYKETIHLHPNTSLNLYIVNMIESCSVIYNLYKYGSLDMY